ncbi:MAG: exonuclease SbcCD subunit D [Alphaproteobacteria bacterium]
MARALWLLTSDVHLRPDRPERRLALEQVFATAARREVDAIAIAGDLFDRSRDAVGERAFVRELVESAAPRPVVLVPGNHDVDAYGETADFGANAVVLAKRPFDRATVCGQDVVGLPYQHGRTVAQCLAGLEGDTTSSVLVAHATVTDGVAAAFAGEGEEGAYMPASAADLLRRFAWTALGHLHGGRNLVRSAGSRLVSYAGSPVATSRGEIGPRRVLLVAIEPGRGVLSVEAPELAVPFWERVEESCSPGDEDPAIARLAARAAAVDDPRARVLARLSGVSLLAETELRARATAALGRAWSEAPSRERWERSRAGVEGGPLLELQAASFEALASTPVVAEFVERLSRRASEEGVEPRLLGDALRIGLGAFLESLP